MSVQIIAVSGICKLSVVQESKSSPSGVDLTAGPVQALLGAGDASNAWIKMGVFKH